MKTTAILLLLLLISVALGCSGTSQTPSLPGEEPKEAGVNENISTRGVLGTWEVTIDPATLEVDVQVDRYAEGHYNVTHMVLPATCPDCLEVVVKGINQDTHIMELDATFWNRYLQNAYDVRAIIQTTAEGHRLVNGDDWTNLWDMPGGNLINPFVAFAKGEPLRKFAVGAGHTRTLQIWVPDPLHPPSVTFTLDVSWPENCLEPYTINNFVQGGVLTQSTSSQVYLYVDVLDWQNNANKVTLVAPAITGESFTQFAKYSGNTWRMLLRNKMGAAPGQYSVRMIATASDSTSLPLYDYFNVTVSP